MPDVSAIILAGGRATRMEGRDKGLVPWKGKPLVEHVLERLQPQVADVVINCNRSEDQYARYAPVARDSIPDYPGPLAGIAAALPRCRHDWVLVTACDMPCLPEDLVQRLWSEKDDALLAVAHDGEHLQPLALLLHRDLQADLETAVGSGMASVQKWIGGHPHAVVHFPDPRAFINLNSLDDLQA